MKVNEKLRWMLVDDDQEVLSVMAEVFGALGGAEVVCFNSPLAAIHALRANPSAFDFVISDFDMPRLNGVEMCHVLRDLAPHLKTILATGNIELTPTEAEAQGFNALLQKPFSVSDLQVAIEKVQLQPALSNDVLLLHAA